MQIENIGRIYSRPESKHLWISYREAGGKLVRRSAGTQCEKVAEDVLRRAVKRSQSLSFRGAAIDFFQVHSREGGLSPNTLRNYKGSLRNVDPFVGDLLLEDITIEVLKEIVRSRRQTVSDASVRRDLAFLSSVISHAIDTLPDAPSHNPVISLRKRHLKEIPRTRWLKPEEFDLLLASCTSEIHETILETAVFTGLRHEELILLRKPNLNLRRKEIYVEPHMAKGSKPRTVPLCARLCLRLEKLCARMPEDLVFAHQDPITKEWHPYSGFTNFWKAARRRAGLRDVRFHDLRHTFASWYVQSGGSLLALKDLLGHSSLQMVQRYAHLNTATHRGEIEMVFGAQITHRDE